MKTLFSRTVILLGFSLMMASCDRDSTQFVNEDKTLTGIANYSAKSAPEFLTFNTSPLDYSELTALSIHLYQNYNRENLDNVVNDTTFLSLVSPLVTKGRAIHKEIMLQIENTEEWQTLPDEDKSAIKNLSDDSYAVLALLYSFGSEVDMVVARRKPDPQIMSCIGVAFGVVALRVLVLNTQALTTVETTIKALRLIGRRYLGWIGVAVMIWEFSSCMGED